METSGYNASDTQGKQRCGVDKNRTLSCHLDDSEAMGDSTDSRNISSLKKSHQNSKDKPHLRSKDPREVVDSSGHPSCVNTEKVIDVRISMVSTKHHSSTLDTKRSVPRFDEDTVDPLHAFHKDITEQDVDDYLDSDALDSDRIPSADIFKVLDTLNLSTSAMKPPTPRGERSRVRRVRSAGYTRQIGTATRDNKKPFEKGAKSSRPPSGKRTGKIKEKNKDFRDSASVNTTASTLIGRTEDLTKHVREMLPGYFTEQYKKILDEQSEKGKSMNEMKTDGAPPSSLSLVAKETTDVRNDLEKLYCQNGQIAVTVQNRGFSGSEKSRIPSHAQGNRSKGIKSSRSLLTGVFVTMDDKRDRVHDVEDSSSGVETMSCVTDSSFENFGDTVNQSDHDSGRSWSSGHVYAGNVRHGFDVYDECDDKIADNDGGVDVDYVDDSDDDSLNFEVVAKTMPLSESRFVRICKDKI